MGISSTAFEHNDTCPKDFCHTCKTCFFFSAKKQISQQNSFLLSLSCAAVKFD